MCLPLLAALPGILAGALGGGGAATAATTAAVAPAVGAAVTGGTTAGVTGGITAGSLVGGTGSLLGAGTGASTAATTGGIAAGSVVPTTGIVGATAPTSIGVGTVGTAAAAPSGLGTGFLGTGMTATEALLGSGVGEITANLTTYAGIGAKIAEGEERKKANKAIEKTARAQASQEKLAIGQKRAQERDIAAQELVDIKIEEARARGEVGATALPSASRAALGRNIGRQAGRASSRARRSQRNREAGAATAERASTLNLGSKLSTIRSGTAGTALGVGSLIAGGLLRSAA